MRKADAPAERGGTVLPTPELEVPVFPATGATSDPVEVFASHVLARGFSPVGRMRQAPAHAKRWNATCPPDAGRPS
ncbi:hypothetical protein [Streptomyces sp. NPDC048442]|uniref:hypothetical protein n=1 Tax=Streptomyces sp. NPDC048442 TaxID=3154823 RepID=UPI0034405BBB